VFLTSIRLEKIYFPRTSASVRRENRQNKTAARKIRDLDDHLYLLRDFLTKLQSGDGTYLKPLAAELRVLACKASGTEGLLWRVLDEFKMDDHVHAHHAGNVDRNHPLVKDMVFCFSPVALAGSGNPRLPAKQWSLKEIIKGYEAVYVGGVGYTHENLIRSVAEQMGSAHEDDGVVPHLISLTGMAVADESPVTLILAADAELVLEVGERTLGLLERNQGFPRRKRAPILTPPKANRTLLPSEDGDFEGPKPTGLEEGSVVFTMAHDHPDWTVNTSTYDFGLFALSGLRVRATKHSDRTMEFVVEGFGQFAIITRQPIPSSNHPSVMVVITWSKREIVFYLNGKRVDSKSIPAVDSKSPSSSPTWRLC
jgi:hypothetical protein